MRLHTSLSLLLNEGIARLVGGLFVLAYCLWSAIEFVPFLSELSWLGWGAAGMWATGAILGAHQIVSGTRWLRSQLSGRESPVVSVWGSNLVYKDKDTGRRRRLPFARITAIECISTSPDRSAGAHLRIQVLADKDVWVDMSFVPATPSQVFSELKQAFGSRLIQPREDIMLLLAPRYAGTASVLPK